MDLPNEILKIILLNNKMSIYYFLVCKQWYIICKSIYIPKNLHMYRYINYTTTLNYLLSIYKFRDKYEYEHMIYEVIKSYNFDSFKSLYIYYTKEYKNVDTILITATDYNRYSIVKYILDDIQNIIITDISIPLVNSCENGNHMIANLLLSIKHNGSYSFIKRAYHEALSRNYHNILTLFEKYNNVNYKMVLS